MNKLKLRQNLPLDLKILMSNRRINEWVGYWGKDNVYISFSGGKDSSVLLHLVRKLYPNIKAVFVDTGLEYPEIKEFVKSVENVEILRPKKIFFEVIKKYGYPVVSKNVSRYVRDLQNPTTKNEKTRKLRMGLLPDKSKVGVLSKKWRYLVDAPFKCSERCCDIMKKEPIHRFEKRTKMKGFVGMMAEESVSRTLRFMKVGCNSFNQNNPQSNPLSFWTAQDILKYIKDFNIPYCNKIYGDIILEKGKYKTTKIRRTGCMFCMFGIHLEKEPNRFQQMKLTHPKIYDYCMDKLELKEILKYIGAKYE